MTGPAVTPCSTTEDATTRPTTAQSTSLSAKVAAPRAYAT